MLRRKPDNSFEYRHVEMALVSARPAPLAAARRDALRLHIMANLGPQEAAPRRGMVRERWVAIPAGIGVAAAIIAASHYLAPEARPDGGAIAAQAVGEVLIDGQPGETALAGQSIVARSAAWIGIADDVRVGMEPGASISFAESSGGLVVAHHAGVVTIVSGSNGVRVEGAGWSAAVAAFSVMKATPSSSALLLAMEDGTASVTASGRSYPLSADSGPLVLPLPGLATTDGERPGFDVPPEPLATNADPAPAAPPANTAPAAVSPAPGSGSSTLPVPAANGNSGNGGNSETLPNGAGASGDAPGQAGSVGNSGNAPGHADPPGNSGNPPGQVNPPSASEPPGHTEPPGNSAGTPGHADPPGASGTTPAPDEAPRGGSPAPPAGTPPTNGPPEVPGTSSVTPPGGGAPAAPGNSGNAPGNAGETESAQPGNGGSHPDPRATSSASGPSASAQGNSLAVPGNASGPANNAAAKASNVRSNHGNADQENDGKPPKLPSTSPTKGHLA